MRRSEVAAETKEVARRVRIEMAGEKEGILYPESESQFQEVIVSYGEKKLNYLVEIIRKPRPAGYPDTQWRNPYNFFFVEFKTRGGELRLEQRETQQQLLAVGVQTFTVSPRNANAFVGRLLIGRYVKIPDYKIGRC